MPRPTDQPSKTVQLRDFSQGLVRVGTRSGIPDQALWEIINGQVIGSRPGQLITLAGPGASIATVTPTIISLWGAILILGGTETSLLITIHADGSVNAVNPKSGSVTVVIGPGRLTSAARLTVWRDTHILFADPTNGIASWDGTNFVNYPATFTATTTSGSSIITWTAGSTPASAIIAGMDVVGTGIPTGTTVLSVVGSTITLSANATASGTNVTMAIGTGAPTAGRDVAVFGARLWVVTGNRGFAFTGSGAFTTWSSAYAGGTGVMPDSIFPGAITRLISALELLWIWGPAAINTISNVAVSGGVTTFQNQNVVAGIGTAWPSSIVPLFRTMAFLSQSGAFAILGSTPQKLSDNLDGLLPSVTVFSGDAPAAVFTLNGVTVYAVLVKAGGTPRLLVYSRPTWSQADQGSSLVWITGLIDATTGEAQVWGTDGSHIVRLFAGSTGSFTLSTKLLDFGSFVNEKQQRRVAVEATYPALGTIPSDLTLTAENELGTQVVVSTVVASPTVTWQNNAGTAVTWQNNAGGAVTWVASGRVVLQGAPQLAGAELGATLKGSTPGLVLGAVAMEVGTLGEWSANAGST